VLKRCYLVLFLLLPCFVMAQIQVSPIPNSVAIPYTESDISVTNVRLYNTTSFGRSDTIRVQQRKPRGKTRKKSK